MIRDIDLDHVAVAVERQDEAWPRYRGELGGEWVGGGGTAGFWSAQVRFANGMKVEVLEPYLVEHNDFLRRFLDRSGPGPHHLTFKVKDIRAALQQAEAAGYRPVNVNLSDPNWQEAFIHPKDAPGVVVQLAQSAGEGDWSSPTPDHLPDPQIEAPATLVHVAHAVASLDEGCRLFVELLAGKVVSEGNDGATGDRAGRVLYLGFVTPAEDGVREVPPEANHGARLVLADSAEPFRDLPYG
jgi:catechol 2,3-dioxygenase-like lactoylglutathione lyase family enzyme